MTLLELRYYFEHKLLPKYYFEDTVPFLTEIFENYSNEKDNNNFLYDMMRELAEKNNIEFMYLEEELHVDLWNLNEDDFMIRISLPEPDEALSCLYIYLLFTIEDLLCKRYFTIELMEKKRKHYCLCEWEEDGFHRNYGYLPNSIEQIEDKIIQLFFQE